MSVFRKWLNKIFNLNLEQKKKIGGYYFSLPFIIGFSLFFLYPFIQSIIFSLSELKIGAEGFSLDFVAFNNYKEALFVLPKFNRVFIETISRTLVDIPLILGFSFFAAILINQDFKGRTLVRVIFFLPVILSAGVVMNIEQTDYVTSIMGEATQETTGMFSATTLQAFFMDMMLPEQFLQFIIDSVNYIPDIIRSSGIQIFIFLAGLQSIPSSLYEAADVEGATGWENFWLITFPMMGPIILVNIVYTVVASFTAADNALLELIRQTSFGGHGYGIGTAMAWIYFATIGIFLLIVLGVISRWVFYHE